jgi:hypothetical protein
VLQVFAGPSHFSVTQRLANSYVISETVNAALGSDDSRFSETNFIYGEARSSAWGFNLAGDVTIFLNEHAGVGGLVRFSRATIHVKAGSNPLRDTLSPPATATIAVGGLALTGGLRLRF